MKIEKFHFQVLYGRWHPPITPQNQPIVKQIEKLVDKILTLTQDPTYDTDPQKQAQVKYLEKQIDHLVYQLV